MLCLTAFVIPRPGWSNLSRGQHDLLSKPSRRWRSPCETRFQLPRLRPMRNRIATATIATRPKEFRKFQDHEAIILSHHGTLSRVKLYCQSLGEERRHMPKHPLSASTGCDCTITQQNNHGIARCFQHQTHPSPGRISHSHLLLQKPRKVVERYGDVRVISWENHLLNIQTSPLYFQGRIKPTLDARRPCGHSRKPLEPVFCLPKVLSVL